MGSAKEYHDRRGVSVPLWLVLCILGGGALVLFMPTGPATHSQVQAKEPSNLEQLRLELDREIASLGSQSVVDTSKHNAASTLLAALPKKKYKKTKAEKLEDEPWKSQLEPLWGLKHNPSADVVMALGFGYSQREFARFVSTLRRTEYKGDIVLAAGPPEKFKRGVVEYLRGEGVLAYQFSYECVKAKKGRRLLMTPAGCILTNWYKDGDKRSPRPLAISRYEMYRTWLSYYEPTSWGIVFDFRDTFFQRDPFTLVDRSSKAPNLHLFAENRQVKRVGNCIFNSGWLRCWGKETPKRFANNSVVCSGSTMGSVPALKRYTERMVQEMDKMKCHATPARTESDQGYHNYLYDTGELAKLPGVRVTHHEQGHGIVNTIGAMNGFRVPKHMKGPLDTHWKIKDKDGWILDYNGERSAVVHQWDRFHSECVRHIDRLADDYMRKKLAAA